MSSWPARQYRHSGKALWEASVGASWWVDNHITTFTVSSELHRWYLLYRLNQDHGCSRYYTLAALS